MYAQEWMKKNQVTWFKSPPESPDFNPVEMVWHQLKEHLRRHVKATTQEELIEGIQDFWLSKMTQEQCQRYIGHLKKVWPRVIEENGGPTGC